jgi:hypothetical protein
VVSKKPQDSFAKNQPNLFHYNSQSFKSKVCILKKLTSELVFTILKKLIASAYVLYTFAVTFSFLDLNTWRCLKYKIDSPLSMMAGIAKIALGDLLFQTFK